MNIFFRILLLLLPFCIVALTTEGSTTQILESKTLKDSIAYELQKASNDTASLKNLLLTISKNRRNLNDDFKPLMRQYIEHTERVAFKSGLMEALDRLGLRERQDGNYDIAIDYHLRSLEIATELADSNQLAYNYSNLGQVYRRQDYNALALKYFFKALRIQQDLGDSKAIYYTQNSIGATYFAQEEYNKAKYFIQRAIEASLCHSDKKSLSFNYGSLGEIYLAQGKIDSAINYFLQSRQLKVETLQTDGIAVADHLLGQAYFAQGHYDKSRKAFEAALSIHKTTNNQRYLALCLAYLGKIDLITNNFYSAGLLLHDAKDIALSIHSLENLIVVEEALSDYYKKKGLFEMALQAIANSYAYRDSIITSKAKRNVQALEVEYQTRKKVHQIELLSKENIIKNQRLRLGIVLLFLLFAIFGLITVIYIQRQRNAKAMEADLQQKLSRSQMNPHFVSNAMGSIQKFMYSNDATSAAKYLGKFAQLNRAVLEHSLVDSIALDEEISMLTNYLEFEQLRLGNTFTFTIEKDDDLDAEMIRIPPLFIQPFVENAVKHGVKDMEGDGRITLRFTDLNKLLKIEVIDNGKGMVNELNNLSEYRSRSMEITHKRHKLLKQKHKNLPIFSLDNNGIKIDKGVHVIIHLPIL